MPRTALLIGATGLVGSHCLPLLAANYDSTIVLARRPLAAAFPGVVERVIDYDRIAAIDPAPVDDVFCALGTTIRKAGSEEAFRGVDHGYPLASAKWARANGARQFILVSSVGAGPDSSNFYLSVKGDLERQLENFGFESLHIFRPSVLLGDRNESRPAERFGQWLARALQFAMAGPLEKYRGMPADVLAKAMVAAARIGEPGRHVYHWREITRLAEK